MGTPAEVVTAGGEKVEALMAEAEIADGVREAAIWAAAMAVTAEEGVLARYAMESMVGAVKAEGAAATKAVVAPSAAGREGTPG